MLRHFSFFLLCGAMAIMALLIVGSTYWMAIATGAILWLIVYVATTILIGAALYILANLL